jgi:hypothetical protein
LQAISGIALRPTNFGPLLWRRSNLQKLASIASALPAAASLLELTAYIRRHQIEILHSTDCHCVRSPCGSNRGQGPHPRVRRLDERGVTWAFGRADAIVGASSHTARTFVEAVTDRIACMRSQCDRPLTLGSAESSSLKKRVRGDSLGSQRLIPSRWLPPTPQRWRRGQRPSAPRTRSHFHVSTSCRELKRITSKPPSQPSGPQSRRLGDSA